ncbi:NADH-ubiquinone oxidoreductase [Seiridium cupressi]
MQAVRQRAACVARRARPTVPRQVRSYASDHGHHAAPAVEEKLSTSFYVFVGLVPASMFFYGISRPGKDGSPSSLTQWLNGFEYFQAENEERNRLRTEIVEQAAHDKHLFLNAGKSPHIDLKMPELINAGAPWNVPAGHRGRNLEEVTEHFRQQHIAEEERKIKKLAAKEAS